MSDNGHVAESIRGTFRLVRSQQFQDNFYYILKGPDDFSHGCNVIDNGTLTESTKKHFAPFKSLIPCNQPLTFQCEFRRIGEITIEIIGDIEVFDISPNNFTSVWEKQFVEGMV